MILPRGPVNRTQVGAITGSPPGLRRPDPRRGSPQGAGWLASDESELTADMEARREPGRKMRKSTWNTYAVRGYTHDVGNDQSSAGGVHLHQVRRTPRGWQKRICQSNGNHQSYSAVEAVTDADGEAAFATATADA